MSGSELVEPFERLLAEAAPLGRLRQIERGAAVNSVWTCLIDSGFLDAMVAEPDGGAGLSLAEICLLLEVAGRHLVPVPFAQTVIARALLAEGRARAPAGRIVLVSPAATDGGYHQRAVPLAAVAEYALAELGGELILTALSDAAVSATGVPRSLSADLEWDSRPRALATTPLPRGGLRPIAAAARAAEIAGAAEQVLKMTIAYAQNRVQFGKPIGQRQAIQQQLAVMAEQVSMARMAAQIGCAHGFPPPPAVAAVAKQVASAAVPVITEVAHAVHGAIGISEEYDLQLYVRRLHEWRIADGSETYWAKQLGARWLGSDALSGLEFAREGLKAI